MDLNHEVEVTFQDCTAILQVSDIQTLYESVTSMDEEGTLESRVGIAIMDVTEGMVQLEDSTEVPVEPGRYIIMNDGLYRRVEIEG